MAAAAASSLCASSRLVACASTSQQHERMLPLRGEVRASPICKWSMDLSRKASKRCVAMADVVVSSEPETAEIEEPSAPSFSCDVAQINSMLEFLSEKTKIAEVNLKVGPSFSLHVKRSLEKTKPAPPPAPPAPKAPAPSPAAPPKAAAAPKPSGPKVSPLMAKAVAYEDLQAAALESGVSFVNAPKVGVFRKSKVVKGRSSPQIHEGDFVKENQVVCFIEHLGHLTAVESDVSGEVVKIIWDDGVPVGYGDPLIAVRPKKA